MKKNKMMRVASALLIAVLLTTSAISGTFAKYTTQDAASDAARVAKWGVTISANGTLFSKTYVQASEGNTPGSTGTITVSSSDDAKVVAPGTQNDTGITFKVTGTPEVKTNVVATFALASGSSEIYVKQGSHTDYTAPTGYDANNVPMYDTFTQSADYYPVVFTLKNGSTVLATGNISAINSYLNSNLNKTFAANTNLGAVDTTNNVTDGTYTLTWAWAFGDGSTDAADTLLGNVAAGTATDANTFAGTMSVVLTLSATQVD